MLTPIRWLRSTFLSIPLIVLGTIAAATLGLIAASLAPNSAAIERIKRAWARWVLAVSFIHLAVEGGEHLPSNGAALYCANHLSYLDPPSMIVALSRAGTLTPMRFLAKDSLFRIPFLGWAMRREGDIPIDRGNSRAAARSLEHAVKAMRGGMSFIAFPEGTRSLDGSLQPFLSGAFRLAVRAQVSVIPVAIAGSHDALRPGSLFLRGGSIRIRLAAPVFSRPQFSYDVSHDHRQRRHMHEELAERVQQAISSMIVEMK